MDEESRREVFFCRCLALLLPLLKSTMLLQMRDTRLEALEADNAGDGPAEADSDDAYDIESDVEAGGGAKSKKAESKKAAAAKRRCWPLVSVLHADAFMRPWSVLVLLVVSCSCALSLRQNSRYLYSPNVVDVLSWAC